MKYNFEVLSVKVEYFRRKVFQMCTSVQYDVNSYFASLLIITFWADIHLLSKCSFPSEPRLRLLSLNTTAENIEPFPERRSNNEDVPVRYLVVLEVTLCACVSVEHRGLERTVCASNAHKHTACAPANIQLEELRDYKTAHRHRLYLFMRYTSSAEREIETGRFLINGHSSSG